MPPMRDFLQRFRPAGAPGAARTAVPADPRRELAAELEPVLTMLDGTATECAEILARARDEVARILAQASAEAAAINAEAEARARMIRTEAARVGLAAARIDADVTLAAARQRAARIAELARQRSGVLTARALGMIRGRPAGLS